VRSTMRLLVSKALADHTSNGFGRALRVRYIESRALVVPLYLKSNSPRYRFKCC
jgi:hypothetical protein